MEPYQHPYRGKERGGVWNQIAVNLSGFDHPKFKVTKRSIRDRLTLLITKHKHKRKYAKRKMPLESLAGRDRPRPSSRRS